MKNQPKEIYLNLGDDVDCDDYNELVESEIGWSTEPCTATTIRYVREDLQDKGAFILAAAQEVDHEPVAYLLTDKRFCGNGLTKDKQIADYWAHVDPQSVHPLYLHALPCEAGAVGLRDQIAIAYMQAQVQAGALYSTLDALSGDAYKMADAMLKERLK